MQKTYLLTGANLGDRFATLQRAIRLIEARVGRVTAVSKLYETEAWGNVDQPAYLNQALEVETSLSPHALLGVLQEIEMELGRVQRIKWGPRPIDIDILFYGDRVVEEKNLAIPHPQLQNRNFVLIPLLELAPELMHPVLGMTIEELYEVCTDELDVVMLEKIGEE